MLVVQIRIKEFIKKYRKIFTFVGFGVVALTIPLTLLLSQQQQDLRQRASYLTPTPKPLAMGTFNPASGGIKSTTFEKNNCATNLYYSLSFTCNGGGTGKVGGSWCTTYDMLLKSAEHQCNGIPVNYLADVPGCPNVNPDLSTNTCRVGSCQSSEYDKTNGDSACTASLGQKALCCTKLTYPTPTTINISPTPTKFPTPTLGVTLKPTYSPTPTPKLSLSSTPMPTLTYPSTLTSSDVSGGKLSIGCTTKPKNSTTVCSFPMPINKTLPSGFKMSIGSGALSYTCALNSTKTSVVCSSVPTGSIAGTQRIYVTSTSFAKTDTGRTTTVSP